MDDAPDRPMDEVTEAEPSESAVEPLGPISERVRISGAEVAGERTGELPIVSGGDAPSAGPAEIGGAASVHLTGERASDAPPPDAIDPVSPGETAVPGGGAAAAPVLPHWTEPPTGEVPAALVRDAGEPKTLMGPTWREEDADWVAHEEEFEPSMFAGEHVGMGSLDESDDRAAERRPWEFDLAGVRPGDPGPSDRADDGPSGGDDDGGREPITQEVPVVSREPEPSGSHEGPVPDAETAASDRAFERALGEPTVAAPAVAAAAAAGPRPDPSGSGTRPDGVAAEATDGLPGEEVPSRARPTGTTRLGRARRNGLLPRMRAKRPEDVPVPEAPLAAEPPGAAVTEVPGAGRKRSLATMAAEDRAVAPEAPPAFDYDLPAETHVGAAAPTVAAASAVAAQGRRRAAGSRWHTPADEPTGGAPPPRIDRPTVDGTAPVTVEGGRRSLGLRIGTGIAVAVVALAAFKLGPLPSLVLAMVLVTFAAGECFGVLRRAGYHPATLLGLVATVALMWGAYAKGVAAIPAVFALLTVFTLLWYLMGIERAPVAGTAATLLTVGWVSVLGSFAALLLAPSVFPDRHGVAFLLGAAIAAVTNDVSALAIGSWIGTRQLAPRISPNKTWEGLIGSAIVTVVVCTVVVGAVHPWDPATAALLGLVAAVVAPLGDLCESMLKRDLRLKDMGTLLPGHGGVLDRLDALLFVVPATYYLVLALHIR